MLSGTRGVRQLGEEGLWMGLALAIFIISPRCLGSQGKNWRSGVQRCGGGGAAAGVLPSPSPC